MRARHLLMAGVLLLAGCVVAPVGVAYNPNPPPPPPRAERIPTPPASAEVLVWRPGHWTWDGQGYAWREGAWVSRAGHGTLWLEGHWSNAGGDWIWVPAQWI